MSSSPSSSDFAVHSVVFEGRPFYHFLVDSSSNPPALSSLSIFLWFVPNDGSAKGSFYWSTTPEERTQLMELAQSNPQILVDHPNRLDLTNITEIHLGKGTPQLQHPSLTDLNPDRCFSLQSLLPSSALHLYSESIGARNSFVSFLRESFMVPSVAKHQRKMRNEMLTKGTQREVNILIGGVTVQMYYMSHHSKLKKAAMKLKLKKGSLNKVSSVVNAAATLKENNNTLNSSVHRKVIRLYYIAEDRYRYGHLCWMESQATDAVGSTMKTRKHIIPLQKIQSVMMGRQTNELRAYRDKADPLHTLIDEACLSIVSSSSSPTKNLHLQFESEAQRRDILKALHDIVTIIEKFDTEKDPSKKFKPFSFIDNFMAPVEHEAKVRKGEEGKTINYVNPNDIELSLGPQRDYPQYDESNPFYQHATALSKGYEVSAYFSDKMERVRIFLDLSEDELGNLYLSPNMTAREKRGGNHMMRMSTLSDVIIGNSATEFQTEWGKKAKESCSFTLVSSEGGSLNVEASSETIRDEILDHVRELFANSAMRDPDKEDHSIPAPRPVLGLNASLLDPKRDYEPTNQIFGITKPDFPIRARLEKDLSAARPRNVVLDSPVAKMLMSSGKTMKCYYCDLGAVVDRPVTVTFDPELGSIGALRYVIPDQSGHPGTSHHVPVVLITDVILGKSSFELRSGVTVGIPSSLCLSIVTDKSVLNVTTVDDSSRKQIVEFLKDLVPSINIALADETNLVQSPVMLQQALSMTATKATELEQQIKTLQIQLERTKSDKETASQAAQAAMAEAQAQAQTAEKLAAEKAAAEAAAKAKVVDPLVAALSTLASGQHFLSFSQGNDGKSARSETVFVWYEEHSGDYGTLFWCVDPQRTRQKMKKTDKQIPLQAISDVFLGKHRTELQCSLAANIGGNRCLSLVASSISRGLHLAADTSDGRDSFVGALQVAFQHAHEAAAAGAANSELDRLCVGDDFVMTPMKPDSDPSAPSVSIPTFLFFDEETRQFYWFEDGQHDFEHQKAMMISEISDVLIGQYSASTQRELTNHKNKSIVSSLCFSLISSRYQLHLQAKDEATFTAWVNGISYLLSQQNEEKTDAKEKEAEVVAKAAAPENEKIAAVRKGFNVTLHSLNAASSALVTRNLVVKYESIDTIQSRYGIIHFVNPLNPTDSPLSLPLDRVTDIFIGKQTTVFQNAASASLSESRCLSLTSKSSQFDILFESTESRLSFVESIQAIYSDQGKQIVQADTDEVEKRGKELLAVFNSPMGLKSHTEDGDEACDVWVEGSALYWKGKLSKSIKFIFLSSVVSTVRGKQGGSSVFPSEINDKRCGIVKSSTISFYFSAEPVKRDQFMDAIDYLKSHPSVLQTVGKIGIGSSGNPTTGSSPISALILNTTPEDLMSRLHSKDQSMTSIDPSPSLSHIRIGTDFIRHFKVPMSHGEVAQEPITLWYQPPPPHAASRGSLMWSQVGTRSLSLDRSFKFSGFTEILLGKETDAWGMADHLIEDERCFTLQVGNYQLNLEAPHKEQVNIWLFAINHILTTDSIITDNTDTKRAEEKNVDSLTGEPLVNFHVPIPLPDKRKAAQATAHQRLPSELKPLDIQIQNYDYE